MDVVFAVGFIFAVQDEEECIAFARNAPQADFLAQWFCVNHLALLPNLESVLALVDFDELWVFQLDQNWAHH